MNLLHTLLFAMPWGMEILLIVLVVIFLFGGKKIPELARGLGKAMREFKDAKKEVKEQFQDATEDQSSFTRPKALSYNKKEE